jgi:hypothetical protein
MTWEKKRKPVILGLDISKTTGWAIFETWADPSKIATGIISFPEKASIEYCADQMQAKLADLLKNYKKANPATAEMPDGAEIDFAVIETALKASPKKDSSSIVSSCMLHGAVLATLSRFKIPWGTIASQSWRSHFFADGFKPPQKMIINKKTGKPRFENDWKTPVVNACERDGISLPPQTTLAHNAAEAAAIAQLYFLKEVKHHAGRYEPAIKAIREQHLTKSTRNSNDLFAEHAA